MSRNILQWAIVEGLGRKSQVGSVVVAVDTVHFSPAQYDIAYEVVPGHARHIARLVFDPSDEVVLALVSGHINATAK